MDVLTLSRLQFALTAGIHYLYPPLSIGLGVMLVIMEGVWLKTRNPVTTKWRASGPRCLHSRSPSGLRPAS